MKLKRFAVTVMDNWTPMREFWTFDGAYRWYWEFTSGAHLFWWRGNRWAEIKVIPHPDQQSIAGTQNV